MTNMELKARVEKLENIQQFMDDLNNATDETEIKEVLANHGLEITLEELEQVTLDLDELSEEALEMVAGGKCKCKGILKRIVTNFLAWAVESVTGKRPTCPECRH